MSIRTLFAKSLTSSVSARSAFLGASSARSSLRLSSPFAARFSQRDLSDSLRTQIDEAVKSNDIVVFMKGNKEAPQCGFSRAVVQILQLQGVQDFKTVNVLADEEVRNGIKEYTSWPTIPQVFVKGEFVGGCDILLNLHQSGELETLLAKHGIVSPTVAAAVGKAES
ncbi:thioredoxin-like protein [Entophlyctis helioformis]|nr:thioredoxin-like protein [Entophlyctis helioformis]